MIDTFFHLLLGRQGRNLINLLEVVLGLTLAMFVLLGAIALYNAFAVQIQIVDARDGIGYYGDKPSWAMPSEGALLRSSLSVETEPGTLIVTILAAERSDTPALPGLSPLPKPGSILISPALASILAREDDSAATLRSWLPGEPTGILDEAALATPGELVAVAVVTPDELRASGRFEVVPSGPGLRRSPERAKAVLLFLAAAAILVPISSLIGVAVRVSATRRDHRYATLRLIGATPRTIQALVVLEAVVAALMAYLLALAIFVLLRRSLHHFSFAGGDFFTRDLQVAPLQLMTLLLFLLATTCTITLLATRQLNFSPLQVQRRSQVPSLRWTRGLWMVTGLIILVAAILCRRFLNDSVLFLLEVLGATFMLVGLVRWTPLLIRWLAARVAWSASSMVAARRLQFDPQIGMRVVLGLALGSFGFGLLQIVGPGPTQLFPSPARVDIVVQVRDADATQLLRTLPQTDGVISSVPISRTVAFLPNGQARSITIGSCSEMQKTFKISIVAGGCGQGNVLIPSRLAEEMELEEGSPLSIRDPGSDPWSQSSETTDLVVRGIYESEFEQRLGLLVDASVGLGSLDSIYVTTDKQSETRYRVFTQVARTAPGAVAMTAENELLASFRTFVNNQRAINAILLGNVVIGVIAFAYGVFGMIVERRSLLIMLRIIGMEPKQILPLLMVELSVPLLAAVGVSLVVGLICGLVATNLLGTDRNVPLREIAVFLTVITLSVLLAFLGLALYLRRLPVALSERTT